MQGMYAQNNKHQLQAAHARNCLSFAYKLLLPEKSDFFFLRKQAFNPFTNNLNSQIFCVSYHKSKTS